MNGRASITIGNYRIGHLLVDPTAIRGEGGALSPALVVPGTLQLDPRDEGEMIAVTEIEADLVLPASPALQVGTQVGGPARASSIGSGGGLWSSIPTGPVERPLTLRFVLAHEHVRLMEDHAQRLGDEPVPLELRLRAGAAWVRQSQDAPRPGPAGQTSERGPCGRHGSSRCASSCAARTGPTASFRGSAPMASG